MVDINCENEFCICIPSFNLRAIGNRENVTGFQKTLNSVVVETTEVDNQQKSSIVNEKEILVDIEYADVVVTGENNRVIYSCSNFYCDLQYIITNNPSIFPNVIQRSGSCSGQRYKLIMSKTRRLTDNGHSDQLFRLVDLVVVESERRSDADLRVIALLQRAVFYVYDSKLEDADSQLDEAIDLACKCINVNFLLGKCYTYKAYVKLYQCKYQRTLEYLDIARSLVAFYESGQEKATICYLFGCTYMKMAGETHAPSADLEMKALEFFKLDARHAQEDPDNDVGMKELRYGIFKQITVYLRTYTKNSYDFPVAKNEICRSKDLLDYFELNLWNEASKSAKIHFASLRADYFFRNNSFRRALDILECALNEAQNMGYKPLINMVNGRIECIKSRMKV